MAANIGAVLLSPYNIKIEERSIPKPGKGEVILSIEHCGICGTDSHFYREGRLFDIVISKPIILGHEGSGTIIAIGEGVVEKKIGDRVAVQPGTKCSMCQFCSGGRCNLCPKCEHLSLYPHDGLMQRVICISEEQCYKIPDNMSLQEASLVEPASVAYFACKKAGLSLGHSVLICGSGPIGALCCVMAQAFGATSICMTDIVPSRVQFVERNLGVHGIHIGNESPSHYSQLVIQKLGKQPDVVFECSGSEFAMMMGIHAILPGGIFVEVAMCSDHVTIPLLEATIKEIEIRGVFRFANCFPLVIDMIASGKVNVKPLITHHFPLSETANAFELFSNAADGSMKVTIDCQR